MPPRITTASVALIRALIRAPRRRGGCAVLVRPGLFVKRVDHVGLIVGQRDNAPETLFTWCAAVAFAVNGHSLIALAGETVEERSPIDGGVAWKISEVSLSRIDHYRVLVMLVVKLMDEDRKELSTLARQRCLQLVLAVALTDDRVKRTVEIAAASRGSEGPEFGAMRLRGTAASGCVCYSVIRY